MNKKAPGSIGYMVAKDGTRFEIIQSAADSYSLLINGKPALLGVPQETLFILEATIGEAIRGF